MSALNLIGTSLVALGMLLVGSHAGEAAEGKKPDREFTLTVRETPHQFFPGGPTVLTWAFNGTVPGPELRVRQGEHVRVTFRNETCTKGRSLRQPRTRPTRR